MRAGHGGFATSPSPGDTLDAETLRFVRLLGERFDPEFAAYLEDLARRLVALTPDQLDTLVDVLDGLADLRKNAGVPAHMSLREAIAAGLITEQWVDGWLILAPA